MCCCFVIVVLLESPEILLEVLLRCASLQKCHLDAAMSVMCAKYLDIKSLFPENARVDVFLADPLGKRFDLRFMWI